MSVIEVDVCHQMAPLRMLCFVTLTFIFHFKQSFYAFPIKIAQIQWKSRRICDDSHGHCRGAALLLTTHGFTGRRRNSFIFMRRKESRGTFLSQGYPLVLAHLKCEGLRSSIKDQLAVRTGEDCIRREFPHRPAAMRRVRARGRRWQNWRGNLRAYGRARQACGP